MDGWMGGEMDERRSDGWMEGEMDERRSVMDGRRDGWKEE